MSWVDWLLWLWFFLALVSIVAGWVWTIILFVAGGRYLKELKSRPLGNEADFLWVFLVPALNEGVTIADSVGRLRAVNATHKLVVVINDGSDDDTGEVLARIAGPDLQVHTRVLPNARKGKAVALNDAEQLSRPVDRCFMRLGFHLRFRGGVRRVDRCGTPLLLAPGRPGGGRSRCASGVARTPSA